MLATAVEPAAFGDEDGWAFEMKWDGVRTVAYLQRARSRLLSRNGRDDTAAYRDLLPSLAAIAAESAILDGEIVVTDPVGRPSFGLLQHRMNLTRPADVERAARTWPAQLMLFDLLALNGRSLVKQPYAGATRTARGTDPARRRAPGSRCHPSSRAICRPRGKRAAQLGLEGVVAKRWTSIYQPGRRARTWLKLKQPTTQEVVIGGWRPGQGRRDGGVGSVLMGVPDADGLRYVGRVGSGFSDSLLDELQGLLDPLAQPHVAVHRGAAAGRPRRPLGAPRTGRRGDLRRAHRARPAAAPGLARPAARQVRRRGHLGASDDHRVSRPSRRPTGFTRGHGFP